MLFEQGRQFDLRFNALSLVRQSLGEQGACIDVTRTALKSRPSVLFALRVPTA